MNGKDSIINKIIKDSELLAESFIAEAEEKADSILANAKTLADDYEKKAIINIETEKKAIIKRKESFAEIEVKKNLLSLKQEIINNVFISAEQKITSDSNNYKQLITELIGKFAEDGDCILVSKKDKAIITEETVKAISVKKGITLNLKISENEFSGIFLNSKNYDKNLTIKTILRQIKDKYITEISDMLFGQGA